MSVSPLIIAHRGASAYAPENTLAAIRMAVEAGADGVEFDVQLASDGVPVVIHDPTLDRTGGIKGNVAGHTSKELGEIGVGAWFNAKYPERSNADFAFETIPTLAQVLQNLESFQGLIYIELKPHSNNLSDLTKAVCDVIRDSHLSPQMILKSFKLAAVPEIKHLLPEIQTAALFEPGFIGLLKPKNLVTIARKIGADQISIHHWLLTPKLIRLASEAGMPLVVWTIDDPRWLKSAWKHGIYALISNALISNQS